MRLDGAYNPEGPNRIFDIAISQLSGTAYEYRNEAGGGFGMHLVNEYFPILVQPWLNYNRKVSLVSLMIGINDLAFGGPNGTGDTPQNIFDAIKTHCLDVKAKGATKVLIWTITSNHFINETDRQTLNTLIRDHWTEFADYLADVGSDPIMGCDGCHANLTYFLDGSHPTVAGNTIIAGYAKIAMQALGIP